MNADLSDPQPARIHPTAIVDPDARIAESATVGPYSVVGPGVRVGERVRIDSHVLIERDTLVGEDVRLCKGAVLGTDPQDLKYAGEATRLEVGPRTTIREYATLNRGTSATGVTRLGADCLVMAYAHVAHDCTVGDHSILANAVNMAGHVAIGSWVTIGGLTAIHQFVRIGDHAFVGGCSRVTQDVAPYTLVAGNPPRGYGLNLVGLRRRGFEAATIDALRSAYRTLFRSELKLRDALDELERSAERGSEVGALVAFVRASERGVTS